MKVTVAIDSFKGSLSSIEAGNAVKEGILRINPDAKVAVLPVADGGEGTVEALIQGLGGRYVTVPVKDPLGNEITAGYGLIENNGHLLHTAVIEMASASGITLVPENKRNPLVTTTYGVGQLISDAIKNGCRNFIIGIGGSATNDGGVGMLQALGFRFLDAQGNNVSFGAQGLKDLASIDASQAMTELKECTFTVACDVNNPLTGTNGCSYIYGPQKGADRAMVKLMNEYHKNYARVSLTFNKKSNPDYPGAGAAGGLGFAFLTFLNAQLKPGIELVLEAVKLEDNVKDSDYVVTGEGRIDSQTAMGKAPSGVAMLAKKYGHKVIAFCGCATVDSNLCNQHGIDGIFPIIRRPETLERLMDKDVAKVNLTDTAEQVFNLLK